MPFTPFHLGPAMLFKAAGGHRFSVLVFGFTQVLIDIEPLIRIIRRDPILHGVTHTIAGATIIGGVAAAVGRPFGNALLSSFNKSVGTPESTPGISWPTAIVSAFMGAYSHLVLDGVMHRDMRPFAPFTNANPMLGFVSLGALHLFCVGAGVVGLAIVGLQAAYTRTTPRKA